MSLLFTAPAFALSAALLLAPTHGAGHKGGKAGKAGKGKPQIPWEKPATPLPFLPKIARVRLEIGRESVLQILDVEFPKDEYTKGDRKFWITFGAPGVPKAVDAHLGTAHEAAADPDATLSGDEIPFESKPTRPRSANALLGPDRTSGLVFAAKESALQTVFAKEDVATLRIRSLVTAPEVGGSGTASVVVRLGTEDAAYTLGRVEVTGRGGVKIATAEARLCSFPSPSHEVEKQEKSSKMEPPSPLPLAETPPLTLATMPPRTYEEARNRVSPVLAPRHPFDALCIRYAIDPKP